MGKFEIKKDKAGHFRFNLKAGNGKVVLTSEAYNSKSACENGIESVRKNSQDASRYHRQVAKNNKPYFNLKAHNGQVIGVSQMYASASSMENGIKSVARNAPGATVMEV